MFSLLYCLLFFSSGFSAQAKQAEYLVVKFGVDPYLVSKPNRILSQSQWSPELVATNKWVSGLANELFEKKAIANKKSYYECLSNLATKEAGSANPTYSLEGLAVKCAITGERARKSEVHFHEVASSMRYLNTRLDGKVAAGTPIEIYNIQEKNNPALTIVENYLRRLEGLSKKQPSKTVDRKEPSLLQDELEQRCHISNSFQTCGLICENEPLKPLCRKSKCGTQNKVNLVVVRTTFPDTPREYVNTFKSHPLLAKMEKDSCLEEENMCGDKYCVDCPKGYKSNGSDRCVDIRNGCDLSERWSTKKMRCIAKECECGRDKNDDCQRDITDLECGHFRAIREEINQGAEPLRVFQAALGKEVTSSPRFQAIRNQIEKLFPLIPEQDSAYKKCDLELFRKCQDVHKQIEEIDTSERSKNCPSGEYLPYLGQCVSESCQVCQRNYEKQVKFPLTIDRPIGKCSEESVETGINYLSHAFFVETIERLRECERVGKDINGICNMKTEFYSSDLIELMNKMGFDCVREGAPLTLPKSKTGVR